MKRRLKQFFCVHWFDIGQSYADEEGRGPIITIEQKIFRITRQSRVCSKCGLTEYRQIGESEFIGWA